MPLRPWESVGFHLLPPSFPALTGLKTKFGTKFCRKRSEVAHFRSLKRFPPWGRLDSNLRPTYESGWKPSIESDLA